MRRPLLSIGLVLGSLLMFVFQPTAAFTVKLLGNANTFGEAHVANSEREVPINRTKIDETSDELSLDMLTAKDDLTADEIDAYLVKYGYLVIPPNGVITEEERIEAIKEFQRFLKMHPTGIIDDKTMRKMRRARCGLADPVSNSKFANFDAKGARKWRKKHLTYKIVEYSKKLPQSAVRETIANAYKMWSDVSGLTFSEVFSGPSDMKLSFTPRKHGDGFPFDGKGGTLAHAFYPENGGIHMEEEESWTIKKSGGIDLLAVAVHEIGHAIGLGHSDVDDAIMAPFYAGYQPDLKLDTDDVAGVQYLYGKPETPIPTTKAPTTKAPTTRAPTTKAPTTKAPTTQAPTTQAPTTQAPTTKAPTTQAPTTKVPTTQAATTAVPTTKAPITMAPTTEIPSTKAPITKAPTTEVPSTKASTFQATQVPTTEMPETNPTTFQPHTTEPDIPTRNFPCPFRFWSAMTDGNRTFGFHRISRYEIVNGRITSRKFIKNVYDKAPRFVFAAAHNDLTGQTFLFQKRRVFRYTHQKLDPGFPKVLPFWVRAAVIVDDQLIAFSFTHVHYLDQDTLEDYVDGEVMIWDEYPGLKRNMRAMVSYGDGNAYVFYTRNIVKLDVYTGEMTPEKCRRKRN